MRIDQCVSFSASGSTELQEYKLQTLKKLNEFNDISIPDGSTLVSLKARRMAVAKNLLGQLGEGVNIEPPFFVGWGCNIFIGDNVYINREWVHVSFVLVQVSPSACRVSLFDNALIKIGDRVLIGPGVCICTGTHQTTSVDRKAASGTSFARPIIIKSDCWIGARATLLDGIHIGAGSTIAAGSVVTHDVAPGCLVGGVPARFIRSLE
jgi:maltose O-acetyltransferase